MANYITVDGGTTNTRVTLICDGQIADTVSFAVGAGAGETGKEKIRIAVREGIQKLLKANNKKEQDIRRILAAGMLTSEFGLYNLPHLVAPVGLSELRDGMEESVLEDISPIPFVFVRGVKAEGNCPEDADMMRGEETELMGIAEKQEACMYMLMGSHTKIIRTDNSGRIVGIHTSLTGELLAAVAEKTILKNAFTIENAEVRKSYLLRGYAYAKEKGTAEALFKVRILRNLFKAEPNEAYSFCLGALLADDVESIRKNGVSRVVVGGNKKLRVAVAAILNEYTNAEVSVLTDAEVDASVHKGLMRIYESKEEEK